MFTIFESHYGDRIKPLITTQLLSKGKRGWIHIGFELMGI